MARSSPRWEARKIDRPHLHYEIIYKGKHQNPINYYFFDLSPEDYDLMIQIAENSGLVMD